MNKTKKLLLQLVSFEGSIIVVVALIIVVLSVAVRDFVDTHVGDHLVTKTVLMDKTVAAGGFGEPAIVTNLVLYSNAYGRLTIRSDDVDYNNSLTNGQRVLVVGVYGIITKKFHPKSIWVNVDEDPAISGALQKLLDHLDKTKQLVR